MRQRNTSGYPLDLPTLDPPVTVPAGGEIDHDQLLAGFMPVGADQQETDGEATGDHVPVPVEPEQTAGDGHGEHEAADAPAVTRKSTTTRKGGSR
jgi:hypothetical protein